MKKIILLVLLSTRLYAQDKLQYPVAIPGAVSDNYFGTIVADPYRWLEDDTLPGTTEWLQEECSLSGKYLGKLKRKYWLGQQLERNNSAWFAPLSKSGSFFFHYIQESAGKGYSLYLYRYIGAPGTSVVTPSRYSSGWNDNVSIRGFSVSHDDKYIAFSISHNGADWTEIRVKSIFPLRDQDDVLTGVKFSNIAWSNDGFFYCRYPQEGNILKDAMQNGSIYYHKLGTEQAQDVLIFHNADGPLKFLRFETVNKGKYLVIYHKNGKKQDVLVKNLYDNNATLDTLVSNSPASFNVVGELNSKFLVKTDLNASRGQLLLFEKGKKGAARQFIPQYKEVLDDAVLVGSKLVCTYLKDADYVIITFDSTGDAVNRVTFPTGSSVTVMSQGCNDSVAMFNFHSFLHVPIVYQYNVNSFKAEIPEKTTMAFDHRNYVMEKVYYTSKDGEKIPMMIAYKNGLKRDGNTPTLLYGYGGFGIINTPFYNTGFASFMQNGGLLAVPCIRGGGEYGNDWHMNGCLANKQNSFDDFISAAEYLFAQHYTCKDKLAIMGGSNGGLLVAAVANQRPDICKAVVAANGLYDMLRYQHFTVGSGYEDEYGCSSNEEQFRYLQKYSPVHNIKDTAYPGILVITSDHDDRVVPLHSYKYVAALQKHNTGNNPILLHVEKDHGHTQEGIESYDIIYSFIYDQLGVRASKLFQY